MTSETPEPESNIPSENASDQSSGISLLSPPPPPAAPPPLLSPYSPPSERVPMWLKVMLPLVGAVDVFLLVTLLRMGGGGSASDVRNASYCIGYVLGNMVFVPLLAVVLFSISKKFRNTKSQLVILFAVWLIVGFSTIGLIRQTALEKRENLRSEVTKIVEFNRKINETDDLNETAKMVDELPNMARNIDGVDELLNLKEYQVHQKGLSDYAHATAQAFQSDENWFQKAISSETNLKDSLAKLNDLKKQNQANAENYLKLKAKALELKEKGSSKRQREFFTGLSRSLDRQDALLKEVSLTEAGMLDQFIGIMTLLQTEWGKWEQNKEGEMIFTDDAAAEKYNALWRDFSIFEERQTRAQKKLLLEHQKTLDRL